PRRHPNPPDNGGGTWPIVRERPTSTCFIRRTRRDADCDRNGWLMKAARVLRFGPPSVITNDDVPQPEPGAGQLLVRVKAAGVGNWDALIREGKVELQPLPIILGSELSGIV